MFESDKTDSIETTSLESKVNDKTVERGQVQAGNTKKASSKVKTLFLAVLALLALIGIVFSIMMMGGKDNEVDKKEEVVETATPRSNFESEMAKLLRESETPKQADPIPPTVVQTTPAVEQPSSTVTPTNQPVQEPQPPAPDPDEVRRFSGDVLVFSGSSNNANAGSSPQKEGVGSPLNDRMTRAVTPSVKANKRGDLTYLLRKGTNIACTLNSKIITTQAGFTRCYVNKDVYSADGKVLLIERGSEIIGEQTTGLNQGQARVFVMWHTVETPKGVRIDIDSPTTGTLGEAGAEAQVDTHFWERFGGAIMLSMVDDIMGIASNRIDNKDYRFENTQENVQNMAEEALRNTINIPPTGYVNQGTLLNIIVARDVDFKDVYELVRF